MPEFLPTKRVIGVILTVLKENLPIILGPCDRCLTDFNVSKHTWMTFDEGAAAAAETTMMPSSATWLDPTAVSDSTTLTPLTLLLEDVAAIASVAAAAAWPSRVAGTGAIVSVSVSPEMSKRAWLAASFWLSSVDLPEPWQNWKISLLHSAL